MVTGINESKTLTKHISSECKCKFDGTKCKSKQRWNNYKCRCDCKKHHICEKDYVWNPAALVTGLAFTTEALSVNSNKLTLTMS